MESLDLYKHFIKPKAGFDWSRVKWGEPNDPRTQSCSYCGKAYPPEDDRAADFIPLIFWNQDGRAAEFCDDCQKEWFGLWSPEGEATQ